MLINVTNRIKIRCWLALALMMAVSGCLTSEEAFYYDSEVKQTVGWQGPRGKIKTVGS